MRVKCLKEGCFGGVRLQARGGCEPLVYFRLLGFGVGYVGEGGHFPCDLGGVPDGKGEGACDEQRVGWLRGLGWFNAGFRGGGLGVDSRIRNFDIRFEV